MVPSGYRPRATTFYTRTTRFVRKTGAWHAANGGIWGLQTELPPRAMRLSLIILSTPPTHPLEITVGSVAVKLNTRMSRP